MREAIMNFNLQFGYRLVVENKNRLKKYRKFIVAGMGGSHLSGDLIRAVYPDIDITIHSDYGLPYVSKTDVKHTLVIASSYSGNTEETIDAFRTAIKRKIPLAAMTTGGILLNHAKKQNIPYVELPETGIQPRMSLGFGVLALLSLVGRGESIGELSLLVDRLRPRDFEKKGKSLAKKLYGRTPIIYSSLRNYAIAYNWKIKFNETGKVPAFYNILPELNHNEMTGFDVKAGTRGLSKKNYFIFLRDAEDHPRILKRMSILKKLYNDRGLIVETIDIKGSTRFHKIFSSLVLADWTAYYTALGYSVDSEQVPMVE